MASLKDSLKQGAAKAQSAAITQKAEKVSSVATRQASRNDDYQQLKAAYAALPQEQRRQYAQAVQSRLSREAQTYSADYDSLARRYSDRINMPNARRSRAEDQQEQALRDRAAKYSQLMDIFGDDMDEDFKTDYRRMLGSTALGMAQMRQGYKSVQDFYQNLGSALADTGTYIQDRVQNAEWQRQEQVKQTEDYIRQQFGGGAGSTMHYSSSGMLHSGSHGKIDDHSRPLNMAAGLTEAEQKRQSQRDEISSRRSTAKATLDTLEAERMQYAGYMTDGSSYDQYAQILADLDNRIASARQEYKAADQEYKDVYAGYNAARKELRDADRAYRIAQENITASDYWEQMKAAETRLANAQKAFEAEGGIVNANVIDAGLRSSAAGVMDTAGYLQELNQPGNGIKIGFLTIGGGDDRMPAEMRAAIAQKQKEEYEAKHGSGSWVPTYQRTQDIAAGLQRQSAEEINSMKAGRSELGQFAVDMGVQGVQMGADAAIGRVIPGGSLTAMALRSFGSGVREARESGATLAQQGLYGAGAAAVEVLTEKMFGLTHIYGANMTDSLVSHAIGKFTSNRLGQAALGMVADALGEGLEEVISDIANPILKTIYNDKTIRESFRDNWDWSEVLYDFAVGAAMGFVGGSVEGVTEATGLSAPDAQSEFFMKAGENGMSFGEAIRDWKALQQVSGASVEAQTDAAFDVLTGKESLEQQQERQSNALQRWGLTEEEAKNYIDTGRIDNPLTVSARDRGTVTLGGEEVKIVSAKGEDVTVEQNGEKKTVKLDELEGMSEGYKKLVQAAAESEYGEAVLRLYIPGQDVDAYTKAWNYAEDVFGAQTNISLEKARENPLLKDLTDGQLKFALELGRQRYDASKATAAQRAAQFKAARQEALKNGAFARKKGTVNTKGGTFGGRTVKGVDVKRLSTPQKKLFAMTQALADAVNINFVVYDGEANEGGSYIKGGTVMVNINSGQLSGKNLGAASLSHELTHYLQDFSPEEYGQLKDFITSEILKASPEKFAQLVQKQMDLEPNISPEAAGDEVIANACQTMLLNSEAINQLARQNMSLAERISDWISETAKKIKAAYKSVDLNDNVEIYEAARAISGVMDEAQKLWDKALLAANENYNAEQATGKKNTAENGGQQNMITGITGASGKYYGVGVLLDSTLLDGLTETERVEMVAAYIDSVQGKTFPAYNANGDRVDIRVAKNNEKFRRTDGKRVAVNHDLTHKYNKNKVKQESIVLLDELLGTSREDNPKKPIHSHEWLDNNGLTPWGMRKTYVQDKSGAVWEAVLQIANADTGEKIIYDIHPINKMEGPRKSGTSSNASKAQVADLVKNPNTKFAPGHQFQMFDSSGKELTDGQQEYFADSKIRDGEGRLKVMYRGGASDITVFDRRKSSYSNLYGRGFYFTDSESHASQYGKAHPYYLNITNPLQAGAKTFTNKQIRAFLEAVAEDEDYGLENYGYGATVSSVLKELKGKDDFGVLSDINATCIGDLVAASELFNEVNGTSIDGIVTPTETVAFRSDQIKETDNKNPTSNPDTRFQKFSADDLQAKYDSYIDVGKELTDVRNQIRTWKNTADYKQIMDDIGKAKGDAIQDAIQAYKEWEDASGFGALYEREKELSDRYDRLRKEYEAMSLENEQETEREQMEKSGKSEGDFFLDKAVKEFGYTPYFYDAGYIVPNGKMLNFSGEKGRHFGSRGQDHRAIGTIFTGDISGSEAMLKFMGHGNIRIMAETPGIDISKDVEPTKEQYAQIRKFAAAYAKEEFFGVDFTDERGNTIGSLEYDGRVRPDRVINDIKHFYETGEVREQGISQFYQKWGIGETEAEQQERKESFDAIKAQNKILKARADYWRGQTRQTKENTVRQQDTDRLANELLREYESKTDKAEVKAALKELGDWLVRQNGESLSYDELYRKARSIAEDVIDGNYSLLDNSRQEDLNRLKDFLKGTTLNISAADFRGTGDEGFRKKYGRYFSVSENGRSLDSAWGELSAMFGEGVFPEDVYAPYDMLNMIADYLDMWKPQYGNEFEQNRGEAVEWATGEIIDRMLSEEVRQTPATYADKAQQKLNAQIAKDREKLDTLRAQKNARIEQIRRQAAEKNKQIRIAEKAAKYEATAKVKQHYLDMLQRQRNRRSDTAVRSKIKKLHKELTDMLLRPKEKRYVPRELVKATAEILGAIDTTTGKSEKASAAFAELKVKYDALRGERDGAMVYDETVSEMLQKLAGEIGNGTIYDLHGEALEAVYNTLYALKHTIQTANKLVGAQIEATAFEAANAMMSEASSAKPIDLKIARKWIFTQATPESMFRMLGNYRKNSMWGQMFRMLNQGQLKQTQILMEGGNIFRELIDDKRLKTLHDQKNLVDIGLKDAEGNAVKITRGMMLTVYMHLLNEENARHVAYGGFTVPRLKPYYQNKNADAFSMGTARTATSAEEIAEINRQIREAETQEEKDALNERLDEIRSETDAYMSSLRSAIEQELTDYDRAWIRQAQYFFDVYSKSKLNEATQEVYGFGKAQVDHYFPIHTDAKYRQASFDTITRDMSLENAGFMKERQHGSNPILLEDITDVINGQLRKTAQYAGLMPAVRNFNKVYGKARAGYENSVQAAVGKRFGNEGLKYIENLMADLNGARHGESNIFDSLRGKMAGAALSINLRVTMSQAASFPTAAAEIGYKPLARALADVAKNPIWNRAAAEEIAKWTPLWWYRMQGFSMTELGDIKNSEQFMGKVNNRMKWLTGWIQAADGWTTGALWQASKYYVDEQFSDLEKGSDAYMMKVAEVYNRVIERTQPDYTTLQRPDILRNPNAVVKQLTMFLTQRLQNTNLVYDAARQYAQFIRDAETGRDGVTREDVKTAKTRLLWAVSSQVVASATIVVFKAAADLIMHSMNAYRDDDDELTLESVSKQLLRNFIETVMSNVLWGSEVYSALRSAITGDRYYGISLNGVESFTDAVSAAVTFLQKIGKGDKEKLDKAALNLAKSGGQFFGVPVNNMLKWGQMVVNHAQDLKQGTFMEAGVNWLSDSKAAAWKESVAPVGITQHEFARMLKAMNADGNSSVSQDEAGSWLKAEMAAGRLTREQAVGIWSAATTGKKTFEDWLEENS